MTTCGPSKKVSGKRIAQNSKIMQKWVQKRCRIFGQNGLQKWSLEWSLSNMPPVTKKQCFWYQILRIFFQNAMEFPRKRSTTAIVKTMSGRNWRELRPCRCPFSLREAAAQYAASQETASKNWREFRPCPRLLFVHRSHSTQQSKNQSQKIGESSVRADDWFPHCTSCTVHSRATGHYAFVKYQPMHLLTFRAPRSKRSSQYTGRPAA